MLLSVTAPAATPALWAATGSEVESGDLAQYGILGIFTGILIWFAKGAIQRERDRADRLEEETRRLNALMTDKVIPALLSASHAAEESANLLSALQRERELTQIVERHRARGDEH